MKLKVKIISGVVAGLFSGIGFAATTININQNNTTFVPSIGISQTQTTAQQNQAVAKQNAQSKCMTDAMKKATTDTKKTGITVDVTAEIAKCAAADAEKAQNKINAAADEANKAALNSCKNKVADLGNKLKGDNAVKTQACDKFDTLLKDDNYVMTKEDVSKFVEYQHCLNTATKNATSTAGCDADLNKYLNTQTVDYVQNEATITAMQAQIAADIKTGTSQQAAVAKAEMTSGIDVNGHKLTDIGKAQRQTIVSIDRDVRMGENEKIATMRAEAQSGISISGQKLTDIDIAQRNTIVAADKQTRAGTREDIAIAMAEAQSGVSVDGHKLTDIELAQRKTVLSVDAQVKNGVREDIAIVSSEAQSGVSVDGHKLTDIELAQRKTVLSVDAQVKNGVREDIAIAHAELDSGVSVDGHKLTDAELVSLQNTINPPKTPIGTVAGCPDCGVDFTSTTNTSGGVTTTVYHIPTSQDDVIQTMVNGADGDKITKMTYSGHVISLIQQPSPSGDGSAPVVYKDAQSGMLFRISADGNTVEAPAADGSWVQVKPADGSAITLYGTYGLENGDSQNASYVVGSNVVDVTTSQSSDPLVSGHTSPSTNTNPIVSGHTAPSGGSNSQPSTSPLGVISVPTTLTPATQVSESNAPDNNNTTNPTQQSSAGGGNSSSGYAGGSLGSANGNNTSNSVSSSGSVGGSLSSTTTSGNKPASKKVTITINGVKYTSTLKVKEGTDGKKLSDLVNGDKWSSCIQANANSYAVASSATLSNAAAAALKTSIENKCAGK